jgi:hypothetical protein
MSLTLSTILALVALVLGILVLLEVDVLDGRALPIAVVCLAVIHLVPGISLGGRR